MHVISIYNNKGGVGKSTLTVGLAEFLASNRKKRVLVIDLDGQASSSSGFLGRNKFHSASTEGKTVSHLLEEIAAERRVLTNARNFLYTRKRSGGNGTQLETLSVLAANKPGIFHVEEDVIKRGRDETLLRDYFRPAIESEFDFVLIDLPSHADARQTVVMNGLVMSDFVLIPTVPPQIALDALPDTFDLIAEAQAAGGRKSPAIIGLVLNQTDRRTQQYRSKLPQIISDADSKKLPPVFKNILGAHAQMERATDYTLNPKTLKQRFGAYYDNVRKVARELEKRCDEYASSGRQRNAEQYATRIRQVLASFSQ